MVHAIQVYKEGVFGHMRSTVDCLVLSSANHRNSCFLLALY